MILRGELDKGLLRHGRDRRGSHLGVVEHGVVAAAVVVLARDDHVVGAVVVALLLAGGVEGVGRDHGAAAGPGGGAGRDLLGEVAQVGAVSGVDVRLLAVEGERNKKVNKMRWNEINASNPRCKLRGSLT